MRIGFIQYSPALGDPTETLRRVTPLVEIASREADLFVLPELANSGYNFPCKEAARAASETISESKLVSLLVKACADTGSHAVAGLNERSRDLLFNTAALIGPNGPAGLYRKLHLFMNEKEIFCPGDLGLPVFDIGKCKVGLQICFDWMFPETWRILALKGADVICHPANLVLPYGKRAIPVHALVNRVFVATANRTGKEGELTFTGQSQISDPSGEILVSAPASGDHVEVAEIDIGKARDKKITPRNDAFADRRVGEYTELLARK